MRNFLIIALTLAFTECFASETEVGNSCSESLIADSRSENIIEPFASETEVSNGSRDGGEVENYVRFAPYAVIAGMKLAGIESRSSNSEFLASFALSNIFMAGTGDQTSLIIMPSHLDTPLLPSQQPQSFIRSLEKRLRHGCRLVDME